MKAVLFDRFGPPDVLHVGEVPDPEAKAGEILVEVHAASVNGADFKVRRGEGPYQIHFPHILGRDFSGVVRAVGPGVEEFAVGDPVFGVLDRGVEGAYAEKLVVPAAIIARKPDALTHAEAAAVALTGLTATWGPLEDTGQLQAGEHILIHGGAGGVGGFALQLARHLGAHVTTTASKSNHDYVRSLGAERVIDYATEDFTALGPQFDFVLDTVGGEVQAQSYAVLKFEGRLVWTSPAPSGFQPQRKDVRVLRPPVLRDRVHLQRISALVESGAVRPPPIQFFLWNPPRPRTRSAKAGTCAASWFCRSFSHGQGPLDGVG